MTPGLQLAEDTKLERSTGTLETRIKIQNNNEINSMKLNKNKRKILFFGRECQMHAYK